MMALLRPKHVVPYHLKTDNVYVVIEDLWMTSTFYTL